MRSIGIPIFIKQVNGGLLNNDEVKQELEFDYKRRELRENVFEWIALVFVLFVFFVVKNWSKRMLLEHV
jgi:hypothetical protein